MGLRRCGAGAFVHCWPYVSPARSAVSTVSALLDVLAQHLVNGARHDVSGAHATVSGTRAGRDPLFESGSGREDIQRASCRRAEFRAEG